MRKNIRAVMAVLMASGVVFMTACREEGTNKESKTDYMVLVNRQSRLPEDWEDRIELVDVYTGLDETYQVEKKAAEAYQKLRAALAEEHIIIELDSTYRTVEKQQEIWDEFMEEYGEEYTRKYVAVPGTSEHHTGLAIDVKLVKNGVIIDDNDDMTAEKELFSRIHARLAEFGFILRYPVGKEDITGYGSEVWHFRYIDDPKTAEEIMDQGLTLEEYLQKNS